MLKFRTFALVGLVGFLLVGCTTPTEIGRPINYAKLERLTVGVSTQQTAKEVFGYPQDILYVDQRTVYKYRYYNEDGSNRTRHAIDMVFNHNQRLIDVTIHDAINTDDMDIRE